MQRKQNQVAPWLGGHYVPLKLKINNQDKLQKILFNIDEQN